MIYKKSIVVLLMALISLPAWGLQAFHETSSRFHATKGMQGVVAAQEAVAARIGVNILKQGGNAVDAAVATSFALMVTLPRAGSLGGGGFIMIALKDEKYQPRFVDFREVAPGKAASTMMLDAKGGVNIDQLKHSWLAVGVPGNVAGLCYVEQHYGNLTLQQVLQPAIDMASNGIVVEPYLAKALAEYHSLLSSNPATKKMFTRPDGQLYQQGDLMRRPDLAKSLKLIQQYGPKVFYEGEIARKIAQASEQGGGYISMDDLRNYKVLERKPINGIVSGYHIFAAPPPSSGGVTLLQILRILGEFPLDSSHVAQNSAAEYHLLAEVFNRVFLDRNSYLGDPDFEVNPIAALLSSKHIDAVAKHIDTQKHIPSRVLTSSSPMSNEGYNTTQVSTLDKDGSMASLTYSINFSYGSGISVPGTGILLNNTMLDFTLLPNHADKNHSALGQKNTIEPNKRPLSSMNPVIVLDAQGMPWLATGSPGGPQIITTVAQLFINLLYYHLPLAEATEQPRIHVQLFPDMLYYESGISVDTLSLLAKMGHAMKQSSAMGSLQTVMHDSNGYWGFSDTRREGAFVATY